MRRCATACLAALPALVLAAATAVAQPAPAAPALADQPATDRLAPPAEPAPPPPAVVVAPAAATSAEVKPIDNDDGKHLQLTFARSAHPDPAVVATVILRRPAGSAGPSPRFDALVGTKPEPGDKVADWIVAANLVAGEQSFRDEVSAGDAFVYAVVETHVDEEGAITAVSPPLLTAPRAPEASWFHTGRAGFLAIVLLISGLVWFYIQRVKRNPKDVYIRRMPGVDALEDAVGRSTEMGRPVLYVTGLEEIQDIMTIASLLILGHVAELTANYDTEIKVANYYPMTMVVAEEIVRTGYANAGRVDAHRPENVLFITAEQFAFAAGVNGIILRDKPATNIYFGKFFGESLLLAETGFTTGAIQIAGTAELPQLPFFIAACDYTLIGEELYATSAYLSREPTLLANLKAGDAFKLITMLFIVLGAALATAGVYDLAPKVFP